MPPSKLRSSDTLIVAAAGVVLATALVLLDIADLRIFLAFALLVSASEMFDVALPSGARYTLGLAPGLGFALYGHHSLAETLSAFGLGLAAAFVVRALSRDRMRPADGAVHLLALAAASGTHRLFQHVDALRTVTPSDEAIALDSFGALILTSVAMLTAVVLIETTLQAARRAYDDQLPIGPMFAETFRSTAALHLAIFSVGALLALSYPTLKNWSFPLFLAPLWATQFAYRQFAQIKKTYLQTIRALSKVPELGGYSAQGHSARVARLAVAIAREMAVPEREVEEIEYAALLHDIGRISLVEPDDEVSPEELASIGAGIVRQTEHFPRVADMIDQQQVAYRNRGEDTDAGVSIGARAIKVASAFDDLVRPRRVGLSPRDVLDRLYLGMAYDYDPDIVKALTRVLEKNDVI